MCVLFCETLPARHELNDNNKGTVLGLLIYIREIYLENVMQVARDCIDLQHWWETRQTRATSDG